jgi:hypothetical protein
VSYILVISEGHTNRGSEKMIRRRVKSQDEEAKYQKENARFQEVKGLKGIDSVLPSNDFTETYRAAVLRNPNATAEEIAEMI